MDNISASAGLGVDGGRDAFVTIILTTKTLAQQGIQTIQYSFHTEGTNLMVEICEIAGSCAQLPAVRCKCAQTPEV
jgi:hypothetical protein